MTSTTDPTPFELDMAEQPAALRRVAAAPFAGLENLNAADFERIVLTGMGSSDYVSIPTWRALVAAGLPAWTVDAGRMLGSPELITGRTLVIATSQSGASGEVVELLRRWENTSAPAMVVGIADPADSALATAADLFLPLHSGPEATVSTKSYLNTLAVHAALTAQLTGGSLGAARASMLAAADAVEALLGRIDLTQAAAATAGHPARRLAFVGDGDMACTARFAGLITKEASKVPAEGFVGGEFRHGPMELAGEGLTAVLLGLRAEEPNESLRLLGAQLAAAGSRVIITGDDTLEGAQTVVAPGEGLVALATSAVVVETFAVQLARANGVVPGAFLHGNKVTTAL